MKSISYILLFFVSLSLSFELHDYHISMCEMHFNEKSGSLEISLKIFIDDLEATLIKEGSDTLRIGTDRQKIETDSLVALYIQKNLLLHLDGELSAYNFIGSEVSEDLQALWCYLELEETTVPKQMNISNTILLSAFDDQTNIVHIKLPEGKQGYAMFKNGRSEETLKF